MQKRQYFIVGTLLFFEVLIGSGIYHNGWNNRSVDYIYTGLLLLFFVLIIRQFFVWQVVQRERGVVLRSGFGLRSHLLLPTDFISVSGTLEFKPETGSEIGQFIKLRCKQGNFRFYSMDYSDFDKTMNVLFSERKDLLFGAKKDFNKARGNNDVTFWFNLAIVIAIILLITFQSLK